MKKLGGLLLAILLVLGIAQPVMASETTSPELDLTAYLSEVSATRGFEVTMEDLELSLLMFGEEITNFSTVEEIKIFMGEVIAADLSNLDAVYTKFRLDQAGLEQILIEYGEVLDDYIYLDDLDAALAFYQEYEDSNKAEDKAKFDLSMYMDILTQIGLTQEELTNLENYLTPVIEYMASPEGQAEYADLSNRILQFGKILYNKAIMNETNVMSEEEYAEFDGVISELLGAMKIQIKFSMIKDGVETYYSFAELASMEFVEDADYKIAIYSENSELLADILVTSEFIKSYQEEAVKEVIPEITTDTDKKPVQTIKGGELPKTAGNYLLNVLLGVFAVVAAFTLFRKGKRSKNEIL